MSTVIPPELIGRVPVCRSVTPFFLNLDRSRRRVPGRTRVKGPRTLRKSPVESGVGEGLQQDLIRSEMVPDETT